MNKRPTYNFKSWLDAWKGLPCLILGRGKSAFDLPLVDIDAFREKGGKVIVVTELGRHEDYFERADAWVFADKLTWKRCKKAMREFSGILWTSMSCFRHLGTNDMGPVSWVAVQEGFEFCPEEPTLFQLGKTSSFLAAQLAWYSGASEIFFSGVDLRLLPDGKTHGDREEVQYDLLEMEDMFEEQAKGFKNMMEYVKNYPKRKVYKTSNWSFLPFETRSL